jgi:hypothetical protein
LIHKAAQSRGFFIFSASVCALKWRDLRPKEKRMNEKVQRAEITTKPALYRLDGMEDVRVVSDITYRSKDSGMLTMDLYYPPDPMPAAGRPAVFLVVGYSDVAAEAKVGCKFKEMESLISWSRLIAASGMVAITYANREAEPDFHFLLQHVRQNGPALGIDAERIGLWATSGNSALALSALLKDSAHAVKCAAFLYPFLLDLDGTTVVAEASKVYKFVNSCAGKSVDDLSSAVPLLIVRAGQDEFPQLNETIDRFVAQVLLRNLPVTLVNHAGGPHAFDLLQKSEGTSATIRQVLEFLGSYLAL